MKFTQQIKPISYLESHASEIVRGFEEDALGPIVITQHGEAKMVVMSIKEYQDSLEQKKKAVEQMAFLKLIAMGNTEIAEGRFSTHEEFLAEMDKD